jgi:predicted lipoprotein with Yx(FWY)xxD motif
MRSSLIKLGLAACLVLANCGDDDTDTAAPEDTTTTVAPQDTTTTVAPVDDADESADDTPAPGAGATMVELGSTEHGEVLVDGAGMALYLFLPDEQEESTCLDQCAATWPPLEEASGVGDGLDQGLLGTTQRTDGTVQATYNGWPLYHFTSDSEPGDAAGQGVGDVWYLVDASGEPVGADA